MACREQERVRAVVTWEGRVLGTLVVAVVAKPFLVDEEKVPLVHMSLQESSEHSVPQQQAKLLFVLLS